jgi:hypothetical protein
MINNGVNVDMIFNKLIMGILLFAPFTVFSEDNWDSTFGVGLGVGYSGLGLNVGIHDEEHSYLGSVGCYSYSDSFGSTCGVGVAWQSSVFFRNTDNEKNHATSFYLGIVGAETIVDEGKANDRAIYGGALSYIYFLNGRNNNGFNFGVSLAIGNAERESNTNTLFQIGYQF